MKYITGIIILAFILVGSNVCSQQVYFNTRLELYSPGSWDALDNCIETDDGYILSGGTGHPENHYWHVISFIKVNKDGDVLFSKILGDTLARYYNGWSGSLIKLQNNNYCFGGGKKYPGDTIKDVAVICKLDQNCDTLWLKEYGNKDNIIDTVNIGYQVKQCYNDDFILVGSQYYYGDLSKYLLIRTDSVGNKLWRRTYGNTGLSLAYSVIQTSDGGFAVGGYWYVPGSSEYNGDPIVIKTDSLGNKEWEKNLGGPHKDNKALLCKGPDGSIIVGTLYADSMAGSPVHGDPFSRIHVIKLDNEGNIIWDKKYGKSEHYNYLTNIRCADNGSIIACGTKPYTFPHWSGWLLKLSPDGDSLWYRLYDNLNGDQSQNKFKDAIPTSDNGFLACGYVFPMQPDTGTQDAWVIKLDSMGCDTPGCATGVGIEYPPPPAPSTSYLYIFPNPSNDKIYFKYQLSNISYQLSIYDLYGRKLDEIIIPKGQEQTRIDVSAYPAGIYVAVLKAEDGVVARGKFVKH